MVRKYDTTFIIDGNLPDAERQALIERFANSLKKVGGNLDQVVRWGLRTLAYPINKRTHGYYVIFYYSADATIIAQFERELRLNENILRYMTLVYDGKHPDYIRDETTPDSAVLTSDSSEEAGGEEEDTDTDTDDTDNDEDAENKENE